MPENDSFDGFQGVVLLGGRREWTNRMGKARVQRALMSLTDGSEAPPLDILLGQDSPVPWPLLISCVDAIECVQW